MINFGLQYNTAVTSDFHRAHNIPGDMSRSPGSPWIVIGPDKRRRQRREKKQKRGCQAGLLARLRIQPHNPPILGMFLSNDRSFAHKMNDMELQLAAHYFV